MTTFFKFTLLLLITATTLSSCDKEDEKTKGCTDPQALNYSVLASEDDGSCEYLDSSFTIWNNGETGYWGNQMTGSFIVNSCFTDNFTMFLNPDSTFTPADTTIILADTTVAPPIVADTIITPADTIITGDTYLLINSDSNGRYELIISLLNKRSAVDFKNGSLIFSAKLHPDATINNFGVFIYGNQYEISDGTNCLSYRRSDPINLFTSELDTSSFKEISLPLNSFSSRNMDNIDLVFGVKGLNATPNTSLIMIKSIKWVAHEED